MKLSFGVICENHHEITTKNTCNNNIQTLNNPTSARIHQTQSDLSIRVESVAYTEADFLIHTLIDGNITLSVFEFLQRDFVSARFKIMKNDLKFLGYQTIMRHFPTSAVTKEIKINL